MLETGRRQRRWAALRTFTRGRCGAYAECYLFGERAPGTEGDPLLERLQSVGG